VVGSLDKIVNGHVMRSILNTNGSEAEMLVTVVELDAAYFIWNVKSKLKDREQNILEQLRLEHLHSEERKKLVGMYLDYQDIFCLPGDTLSSLDVTQHSMCPTEDPTYKYQTLYYYSDQKV
jgi:hypothetical protein